MTQEISSDDRLMAAFAYWGNLVLGFVPALIIFILKKDESPFIKKHALQCLIYDVAIAAIFIGIFMATSILGTVLGFIPVIGWLIGAVIWLAYSVFGLVAWLYPAYLGYKVYQGEDVRIPKLTEMIEQHMAA